MLNRNCASSKDNLDTFKYFYLFFAKNAFIPDSATGKTWLDQHLKGSEDYATRISEKLKELIFDRIFESLATGFVVYRRIESGIKKETDESLNEIFNGCLTLLYRLLLRAIRRRQYIANGNALRFAL